MPMPEIRLTTREWDALGSLLLPEELGGKRTLGPKTAAKLEALGYVERFEERIFGRGGTAIDRIPVIVRGWRMTLMGNAAYCFWAAEHYDGPPFVRLRYGSAWQQLTLDEARFLADALLKSVARLQAGPGTKPRG